jgi:glycosyltransferase involved in cell wall biosynthesis
MSLISIIVPTHNRATTLWKTLNSVAAVVKPSDPVEIIIVDNGSTDNTVEIYKEFKDAFPDRRWIYAYEPMPGLLSGRHRGAKEAQGNILAFLDDDVLLARGWLEALREAFADPGVTLVGGPSRPYYEIQPPNWLNGLWEESEDGRTCGYLSLVDQGSSIRPANRRLIWGLNFSIRKTVFQDCGGFHPDTMPKSLQRYQGDGESGLALNVKEKNLKALYHPEAGVAHMIPASRLTVESFEERAFFQGVCDSYTQIRRERRVPPAREPCWKDLVRPLKRTLERKMLLRHPTAENVRWLMRLSYFDGAQFHGNEARDDPTLFDWVLRDNYFDYRLPQGWESYVTSEKAPVKRLFRQHS